MLKEERLRQALYAAAKIVEKFGEDYLIFIERIHTELTQKEKMRSLSKIALEILETKKAQP